MIKILVRGASGPPLAGTVPQSIEAEPGSALAQMYNGQWDYAKDVEGRAVVNSDPDNWPTILNWLSFGAVSSIASESLVSKCKFWQLDKLLAAMSSENKPEAAGISNTASKQSAAGSHDLEIVQFSEGGQAGFQVTGMIHQVPKRLLIALHCSSSIDVPFAAAGRDWKLTISHTRALLALLSRSGGTRAWWTFHLGSGADMISRSTVGQPYSQVFLEAAQPWGTWGWDLTADEVESMQHPRMLSIEGSIQLSMTIVFK